MGAYPTDNRGLARPIEEVGFEVVEFKRRETNRHHLQYERADYNSPLHRVFRGLCNRVVDMRIIDHNELHRRFSAPRVPKDIVMVDVIEEYYQTYGVVDIVREKKTHETYQLTTEWEKLRDRYRGDYVPQTYESRDRFTYLEPGIILS